VYDGNYLRQRSETAREHQAQIDKAERNRQKQVEREAKLGQPNYYDFNSIWCNIEARAEAGHYNYILQFDSNFLQKDYGSKGNKLALEQLCTFVKSKKIKFRHHVVDGDYHEVINDGIEFYWSNDCNDCLTSLRNFLFN